MKTKLKPYSLCGDELLVSVFAQFPTGSCFPLDDCNVVEAFYELSRKKKFSPLFVNYPFDWNQIPMYSSVIETAMDALRQSRLLVRRECDLGIPSMVIASAMQLRYEKYIKSKVDEDLVKELSSKAGELLRIHTPVAEVAAVGNHKFKFGDLVKKVKGASWTGRVVGFYSTKLTPLGYAVESENEPGSVQIYPESALAIKG